MAFPSAAGYGNLPNGNWSPVIFAKKAQIAFRKRAVVQLITNTDYVGEIAAYGDTVRIIKEPDITVQAYTRGAAVIPQDLDDEELTLVIDKANWFSFKIDDIEKRQSHIGWEDLAANRGGYKLADTMDTEILSYMSGQVTTANSIGTSSVAQDVQVTKTSGDFTPLELLNRFQRLLNEANVPEDNRWFVADPYFYELLGDEDSKLLSDDYSNKGILRNGMVVQGKVRGFTLFMSNNLPSSGAGPTGTVDTDHGVVMAGHKSSTAMAEQIKKMESFRDPDSFGDIVRGLHVYGRKVLRTEAIVQAYYHSV